MGVSRESSAMPDNNFIIRRHRCHNELPLQAASMLEASTFATRRATRRLSAGDLIQCSTTETLDSTETGVRVARTARASACLAVQRIVYTFPRASLDEILWVTEQPTDRVSV